MQCSIVTIYVIGGDNMMNVVKRVSLSSPVSSNQDQGQQAQTKNKKQHFLSQVEGSYYCTYLVNEDGIKVLLNKIPVGQMYKKRISAGDSPFGIIVKSL
jgi:hypothetical protein